MRELQPLFLFSVPRSGSTLLQRMLGGHSAISTQTEPWVLLPQLYSLRSSGTFSEYGHGVATKAIEDFCSQLPGGRDAYLSEIRALAMRLYGHASTPGCAYFLDKTPRYHLVCADIIRLFDQGRFIFLWRNPLAVVASIVDTWAAGRWRPYLYKVDLFGGLASLIDAYEANRDAAVSLQYEELIRSPREEVGRLLDHLGLEWEDAVLEGIGRDLPGRMGDPTEMRRRASLTEAPLHKWRTTLATPVRKRWCRRYLEWIGGRRLDIMGYDLDDLLDQLAAIPSRSGPVASDVYLTMRAAAWAVAEPTIARSKLSRVPDWRRIYSHS